MIVAPKKVLTLFWFMNPEKSSTFGKTFQTNLEKYYGKLKEYNPKILFLEAKSPFPNVDIIAFVAVNYAYKIKDYPNLLMEFPPNSLCVSPFGGGICGYLYLGHNSNSIGFKNFFTIML